MKARLLAAATAMGILGASAMAQAQVKIGVILSISGPAAAMGVGYKGAFDFFPTEIAGQKVEYIIRDDATDANTAFTIAQKMIAEDHVDAFIGPSLTASDAAVAPLANQAHIPSDRKRDPAFFEDLAIKIDLCGLLVEIPARQSSHNRQRSKRLVPTFQPGFAVQVERIDKA